MHCDLRIISTVIVPFANRFTCLCGQFCESSLIGSSIHVLRNRKVSLQLFFEWYRKQKNISFSSSTNAFYIDRMSLHRMHITNMPTCKAAFGQENPCICSDCEITGYIARNVSSYYLARTRQFSRCSYYFIGDMPSYRMNRSEYNRRVGYNWEVIEYTAAKHIFHMQEVIMNQNTNKSTVRT